MGIGLSADTDCPARARSGLTAARIGEYHQGVLMRGRATQDRVRRESRRPSQRWEVTHLENLGRLLRHHRKAASLTQGELGNAAELSLGMISQIELGYRRTRRSTLARIAQGLAAAKPAVPCIKRRRDRCEPWDMRISSAVNIATVQWQQPKPGLSDRQGFQFSSIPKSTSPKR